MDFLLSILTSNGGALGIVLGLLWLAFWTVKTITKISTNHDGLKSDTKTLDDSIREIQKDISYIKGTIELINRTNSNENSLTKSHSPISLTDKGKEVSVELKISERITRNWDKIHSFLITNLKSKNAYDIQQFCIETAVVSLEDFFSEKDVNEIKDYVYAKGDIFAGYANMIGVEVRDRYFETMKIDLGEVDKFDPNKK